jgi:D-glycero-alpha-D-manno-heptose-7-phosphate kinase
MIISQTPFRISFFGGGTDYPAWYREHGGAVISTTINKYGYITCRHLPPFFEHKHRIVYTNIEKINDIADINHPSVRAVFQSLAIKDGLEIHYDGDLPARSGIGSSSSFTVGLLNTLYAMRGEMKSKRELAETAIHIEQNVIKETVGSQDQVAAAFGGINRVDFLTTGGFEVRPVIIPPWRAEEFNDHLMLFFTGFSRIAATVAKSKIDNFAQRHAQLHRMREMVDEAQNIFQSPTADLNDIGRMLHEGWCLKRELSDKVSSDEIDQIYIRAREFGALGGKLIGAGGGGFILLYAHPQRQAAIREALKGLIEVDFRFEYSGSQIILYNPDLAAYRRRQLPTWADGPPVERVMTTQL